MHTKLRDGHGRRSVIRKSTLTPHTRNVTAILRALSGAERGRTAGAEDLVRRFPRGALATYQLHLLDRFAHVIRKPSFHYISKTRNSWIVVGDRRAEIAADISLIAERHGIGVAMLVLHLQQLLSGHIPQKFPGAAAAGSATGCRHGLHGETLLHVPIRRHRSNYAALAALDIVKPPEALDRAGVVSHERDGAPCFYCSSRQMNPREVVVELDGHRFGLSRDCALGFTHAPFGNPFRAVHFLAWDRAARPLNMSRVPMTVSDLVALTARINESIRTFFAPTEVRDAPVIDGVSNAWAGNTIFHGHVQFFAPEHPPALLGAPLSRGSPLVSRDDVTVDRFVWPVPAYRVSSTAASATGIVGNDLTGLWQMAGDGARVPYKLFPPGHRVTPRELVPAHTQNLYVPGAQLGRLACVILRDRRCVDFKPEPGLRINPHRGFHAVPKRNLGVLEASGTVLLDEPADFEAVQPWGPADVSMQVGYMLAAIAPHPAAVLRFEQAARGIFPA